MKVVYDDPSTCWVHIKTEALGLFLREQGASARQVFDLQIHLCEEIPTRFCKKCQESYCHTHHYGVCDTKQDTLYIAVCPKHCLRSHRSLNTTLLHEIRHWLKGGYMAGETALPYEKRPSEIDARAFAALHEKSHQFVTVDRQIALRVCVVLASALAVLALATCGAMKLIGRGMR